MDADSLTVCRVMDFSEGEWAEPEEAQLKRTSLKYLSVMLPSLRRSEAMASRQATPRTGLLQKSTKVLRQLDAGAAQQSIKRWLPERGPA